MSGEAGLTRTVRLPLGYGVTMAAPRVHGPGVVPMTVESIPHPPDPAAMPIVHPAYVRAVMAFVDELAGSTPKVTTPRPVRTAEAPGEETDAQ